MEQYEVEYLYAEWELDIPAIANLSSEELIEFFELDQV